MILFVGCSFTWGAGLQYEYLIEMLFICLRLYAGYLMDIFITKTFPNGELNVAVIFECSLIFATVLFYFYGKHVGK